MLSAGFSLGVVCANPAAFRQAYLAGLPSSPVTDQPIVDFSPPMDIVFGDEVSVAFSVAAPSSWVRDFERVASVLSIESITQVSCLVDEEQIFRKDQWTVNAFYPLTNAEPAEFSVPLSGLSAGQHYIRIQVAAYTLYFDQNSSSGYRKYDTSLSATYALNVLSNLPGLSIISPLNNQTYSANCVELSFVVDNPLANTTALSYTLDAQGSTNISNNVTITGLSNGSHNITIYATDTPRLVAEPQTLNFTITEPAPTQAPTASPTETPVSIPSNAVTLSPSVPELPTWITVTLALATTLIAVAISRKRKERKRNDCLQDS
jgi:hypothetical protein